VSGPIRIRCNECFHIYENGNGHDCPRRTQSAGQQTNRVIQLTQSKDFGFAAFNTIVDGSSVAHPSDDDLAPPPGSRPANFEDSVRAAREWSEKLRKQRSEDRFDPENPMLQSSYRPKLQERCNMLADECGRLKDENRELLVENAKLRRALDKKGGSR
jgi:hypothetical protein